MQQEEKEKEQRSFLTIDLQNQRKAKVISVLNTLVSLEANLICWLEQLGLERNLKERCKAVKSY